MEIFLENVLRWLVNFRTGIFILLGLGILIYLRKFIIGIREWRKSVFGLERYIAKRKLASATGGILLLFILIVGEFLVITVISPKMPVLSEGRVATIDPLATPTATLAVDETQQVDRLETQAVLQESLESECVEGVLEITSPSNGETVSGIVELFGSVNVPDFGYYKYEYSTIGTIDWITIAAEDQLKLDESLGNWNTTELTPGPYLLQIVPLDNVGQAYTPCIIGVEVVSEEN